MKLLFSVCGIGLGHATRSYAILKHLRGHFHRIKLVTYGDGVPFFEKFGEKPVDVKGYSYKGQFSFSVLYHVLEALRDPTKFPRFYENFKKVADEFKPDVIYADSDPNSVFYGSKRGIPVLNLTNLVTTVQNFSKIPREYITRDLNLQKLMVSRLVDYMVKNSEMTFVPSFESRFRYIEGVKYTDLIVRKKPSELPSSSKLRSKLDLPEETYYVSIGGSDIERHLFPVLREILPLFEDKFFVIASNYAVKKEIHEKNMRILPFVDNVFEYIKASKGVIAPAGHSIISESIVFKKPMMVVPIINHIEQMVNAALVYYEGFGQALFFKKGINKLLLKVSLSSFFQNIDEYNYNLKNIKLKGNGAEKIADYILKKY